MALTNKKLSSYNNLESANIDSTTKLVTITGSVKENKNLELSEFVEDSLVSNSTIKPLSANQGRALKLLIDNSGNIQLPPINNNSFKYPWLIDGSDILWTSPVNNLNSTSIEDGVLSAMQGKILNDKILTLAGGGTILLTDQYSGPTPPTDPQEGWTWFSTMTANQYTYINGSWITA